MGLNLECSYEAGMTSGFKIENQGPFSIHNLVGQHIQFEPGDLISLSENNCFDHSSLLENCAFICGR